MSIYLEDDYSMWSDSDLLACIARWSESVKAKTEAYSALKEFCSRGYGDYIIRICRAIQEHIISPVSVNDLLPSIFLNLKKAAYTFHPPKQVMETTKLRQIIHNWLNLLICDTILERSNDKELMTQIAQKDESEAASKIAFKAWGEIRRRYEGSLLKHCICLVRESFDIEVAHDIVSETFLKVLIRAETYDDKGITDSEKLGEHTQAWINRIAHNLYIDEVRRRNKYRLVDFDRIEELDALLWHLRAWSGFVPNYQEVEEHDEADENKTPHLECLIEALRMVRLTPRERDIHIMEGQQYPTEKEKRQALRAIEEAYEINPSNRRKISSRTRRKLGDYMAAHCEECRRRVLKMRKQALEEGLRRQSQKDADGKKQTRKKPVRKRSKKGLPNSNTQETRNDEGKV